jgi:hypothetical protein
MYYKTKIPIVQLVLIQALVKKHGVVGEKILRMSVVSFDNKGKIYFYQQLGLQESDIKYFTAVKLKIKIVQNTTSRLQF